MLATVSTVDALATSLEGRVLEGEFAPGEHLREQELTAEYEVARHSLRAAADALVRRGILVKRPNRGFFVPELGRRDAEEVFELRRAYELPAVRALAERRHIPDATKAALDSMHLMDQDAPWREMVVADRAFHRGLVESLGNSRFNRAHADLLAEISLCLAQTWDTYERPAEVARQHEELLNAIASGDPDVAERQLDIHFAGSLGRVPK